jgi:hypothetical protein
VVELTAAMGVLDELGRLLREPLCDEHDVFTAVAEPGLDTAAIVGIADRTGAPLPADLRALLGACAGISGLELEIDFTGGLSFEMVEIFPHGLPIMADGQGNFWVIDCVSRPEAEAAIFFACHDPPVMLWQGRGLAGFLRELVAWHTPPNASLLVDVAQDALHDVWGTNPGGLTHAAALASPDAAIGAFAATLDDGWTVVDLRGEKPGFGFSWGRFGPRTRVRRHGDDRLFAIARPEPRPGLLSRLFGR